jgi:hypothetical protein
MNYGPSLLATLEVGDTGNFADKGIAVRLDSGPGGVSRGRHWVLFDHDTLRAVAAWSGEGFIDWNERSGRAGQHTATGSSIGRASTSFNSATASTPWKRCPAPPGLEIISQWYWQIQAYVFQPLGLKIVQDRVYVCCRDQIVILHDLNGDGETDFYECFNNDHQVTEHFHEFAMGLQTDAEGNFYYAKAARHTLKAVVPHHGTLLRVSKDGSRTDILATGFRAPNGVCVNPDGTFFLTDQEGFWVPKNRIDLVERGGYYGNFWGYHDVTDPSDAAMKQPLLWINNAFDRSPSELLWVTGDGWGPLKGSLLNFSYGYGKVYVVPYEKVGGQVQGGMCELPLFPTGVMRGRFHPGDGQLYCCGMFAWAGDRTQPGGFYRVRYTGKPVYVPVGIHAAKDGVTLRFSGPLDPKSAGDARRYAVKTWSLKRSEQYGSEHYDEKPAKVTGATVSADGKSVTLHIEDVQPTWSMEIRYDVEAADGSAVTGFLHNTIHRLAD